MKLFRNLLLAFGLTAATSAIAIAATPSGHASDDCCCPGCPWCNH